MKRLGISVTFGKLLKDICYIVSWPPPSAILNSRQVRFIQLQILTRQENRVVR